MAAEEAGRKQAIRNIRRRRGLVSHAVWFIVINIIMIVIWYATGRGYFWPAWVILATGIGLVFDLWNINRRGSGEISEEDIRREMDKSAAK